MYAYENLHPLGNPITFCLVLLENGLTCSDLSETLFLLDEPAEEAVTEAFILLTKFGGLNPPQEVRVSHQQIMDCIDYQIMRINFVRELIRSNITEAPLINPCTNVDLALQQVIEFSENH